MNKARLEAFSDGVIAIIITIMVLEMKVPHETDLHAILAIWPVFLSYVLSFINIGIYWNNHHHLLTVSGRITGGIMWANLHLLFWLSLVPFSTGWMGEHEMAALPAALYGAILLMAAVAYYILQQLIVRQHPNRKPLDAVLGRDFKGRVSPLVYLAAIATAFINPVISYVLYAAVALMWIVPDRRLEKMLQAGGA